MRLTGPYAIHLHRNGQLHSFLRGDDVPGWAVKLIDNPYAWETAERADQDPEPVEAGVPPKAGPGASRQAWADYAESKGVAVELDWKREDIIAAVDSAGF